MNKKKRKKIREINKNLIGKISFILTLFSINGLVLYFFNADYSVLFTTPLYMFARLFDFDKYFLDLWKNILPLELQMVIIIWCIIFLFLFCYLSKISYKKIFMFNYK